MFKSLTATTRDVMAGRPSEVHDPLLPPGRQPHPEPADRARRRSPSRWRSASRSSTIATACRRSKPTRLVRMPAFPNDEPHPETSHGDLLIQICADHDDTCTHALRRLMRTSRKYLTLRWMLSGFVRPNQLPSGRTSVRNLLGFKDGTANLDVSDAALMNDFVWVQQGDGEPSWAVGGSYMAVRVIRNRVEFWDRTALRTQELIIGRSKATGAPLDGTLETDIPRYADDPDRAQHARERAHPSRQSPHGRDQLEPHLAARLQLQPRLHPQRPTRPRLAVHLFPARPRRRASSPCKSGSTAKRSRNTSSPSAAASTSPCPASLAPTVGWAKGLP